MCPVTQLAAPCPAGLTNPTMPIYKIPTKKTQRDEIDGLIILILALVAVPPAAWVLAAIFNAIIF